MTDGVNTAIVRRYIEEWANEGNEATLNEVIAPDWLSHGTQSATATPAGLALGIDGAKQLHDEVRAIWPDNRWTIEDIFGSGDRVAVRMTNRATHRGTYRGIPPAGKRVTFGAIWIFRLAEGRIAEVWRCADDLGRVVQLGGVILPPDNEHPIGAPPA
jgi:predicted ester cyclase